MRKSFDDNTNSNELLNATVPLTKDSSRSSISSETDRSVSGSSIQTTVSTDLRTTQKISQSVEVMQLETSNTDNKNINDLHKSADHLNLSKITGKLPERRVSDVTRMHRKSIIHKQGSRTLGSRIAATDYVDPRTLFINQTINYQLNSNSKLFAHVRTDSAFSLTSSNDSVNLMANQELQQPVNSLNNQCQLPIYTNQCKIESEIPTINICKSSRHSSSSGDDSYYEKTVETYLENDGIFRDSAIYSDDNTDKTYTRPEHIYSTIDEVKHEEKSKPIPPPKLSYHKIKSIATRTAPPPPPLPVKPSFISIPARNIDQNIEELNKTTNQSTLSNISCTTSHSQHYSVNKTLNEKFNEFAIGKDFTVSDEPVAQTTIHLEQDEKNVDNEQKQVEIQSIESISPPPIPARSSLNKNSSWVLKQIQNFDK